jgi:hypothetical protein
MIGIAMSRRPLVGGCNPDQLWFAERSAQETRHTLTESSQAFGVPADTRPLAPIRLRPTIAGGGIRSMASGLPQTVRTSLRTREFAGGIGIDLREGC